MHIFVFSLGIMLMMVAAVNCKRIRRTLRKLWPTDSMDRIALILALGVPGMVLVNWMGYWV